MSKKMNDLRIIPQLSLEAWVGFAVVAIIASCIALMIVFCSCNEDEPCDEPQTITIRK